MAISSILADTPVFTVSDFLGFFYIWVSYLLIIKYISWQVLRCIWTIYNRFLNVWFGTFNLKANTIIQCIQGGNEFIFKSHSHAWVYNQKTADVLTAAKQQWRECFTKLIRVHAYEYIIFDPVINIFYDEFCCSRVLVTFTLYDRMISNHWETVKIASCVCLSLYSFSLYTNKSLVEIQQVLLFLWITIFFKVYFPPKLNLFLSFQVESISYL